MVGALRASNSIRFVSEITKADCCDSQCYDGLRAGDEQRTLTGSISPTFVLYDRRATLLTVEISLLHHFILYR